MTYITPSNTFIKSRYPQRKLLKKPYKLSDTHDIFLLVKLIE